MTTSSGHRGVAHLRFLMTGIMADHYKAYDLPSVCERLGMDAGQESEAFNSKRLYVKRRIEKLSQESLFAAARYLAAEIENPELDKMLRDNASPADAGISEALSRFDEGAVHRRWEAALERRATDPEGAITLARTLLEDVCKWLLVAQAIEYAEKDDLPLLYRRVASSLNLAPDDHTEDIFKRILGSCQSVVESLGTLRNKLSDSHSPGPKRARPLARHAELAVNLSGAMSTFLIATWEAKTTPS